MTVGLYFGERGSGSVPPPTAETSRIYLLIGQSHQVGYGRVSEMTRTPSFYTGGDTYGCWVWDKIKRDNLNDITLTDTNRNDEAHTFKPLRPGWGDAVPEIGNYWWETPLEDPAMGLEMQFGTSCKRSFRKKIYLVKYAISGSQLYDRGDRPTWNINTLGLGNMSNLQICMDAYWTPAKASAAALAGGLDKLVIGGVINFIGFTDSKDTVWADAYEQNLRDMINHIRGVMHPAAPTQVPWCQVVTPRYYTPEGAVALPGGDTVRAAQQAVTDMPNVVNMFAEDGILLPDGVHFDARSTAMFGETAFRALRSVPGVLAG